jgi:hypothetical protein
MKPPKLPIKTWKGWRVAEMPQTYLDENHPSLKAGVQISVRPKLAAAVLQKSSEKFG